MYIISVILSTLLILCSIYFLYKSRIKIKKHTISLVISIIVLLFTTLSIKTIILNKNYNTNGQMNDVIKIAVVNIQAPYVYYNSNGDLTGLEIDIINNVANKLNKDTIFIEMPLENIAEAFDNNIIDIAIGGLFKGDISSKSTTYTTPYISTNLVLYSNKKNSVYLHNILYSKKNYITPHNFSFGTEITNKNFELTNEILKKYNLKNKFYKSQDSLVKDVEQGLTTFALGDEKSLKYRLLMNENSNLVISNYQLPKTIAVKEVAFLIKKDSYLKELFTK